MDSTQLLESKKFVSMLVGVLGCLVAGTTAVALGSSVGISALPYVIGGIVAISGAHLGIQGLVDNTAAKQPVTPTVGVAVAVTPTVGVDVKPTVPGK